MRRKPKSVSAWLWLSLSVWTGAAGLLAGTTGKISGVVLDAVTKQPLVGANVIVTGAGIGAAVDLDGSYAILNVPPGTYTVRFTMMGYRQTVIENARVSIDMTTVLDGLLSPTVLNSDEIVIIQAERPLVKKDMTSSLVSVSSDEISNLPVSEVSEVLALQAGVVRSDGLHIRGGRSNEIAYWVDGVSATNVFSGTMGVTVENAAIKELQVISGTFNAEYGQAMSGIVNIITKEGSEKYTGQVRAYVGDYVSPGGKFGVLKSVRTGTNTATGKPEAVGVEQNPLSKFNPVADAEMNLSGPVPGFGRKLTFFANARVFSNEGYLYGRDWFRPTGAAGDSGLVPMSPYERQNVQVKLKYQAGAQLKFTHNVFWSHDGQDRVYNHLYKYNPYGTARHFNDGLTQIFTMNHVLSEKMFYELKLSRFDNTYKQYVYENPEAKPDYLVRMTDAGGNAVTFDPVTAAGRARLDSLIAEQAPYSYIVDPDGPDGYIHHDQDQSPTPYSFLNDGMDRDHFKQSTGYWLGKLDLTSQVNRIHQIKAGVEMRLYRLFFEQFTLRPKLKTEADEEIVPYEPEIKPLSSMYHWKYDRKPKEFSAYAQDKIELNDLIVNLGLRFDYFNSMGVVPADPSDPNIYYPFKDAHIYRNPDAPDSLRVEYTPDERRAFMHKKAGSKTQVSPRLGIAYPVTDRGVIHFSYGHFFQIPTFNYLYDRPDFKIDPSTTRVIMGNADLKPQRTVQYEIGLQQQVSDNIGMDVTVFYRDVRDWVSTSAMIVTPMPGVEYARWENKDYSNVRGVTVGVSKRFSNRFSAELDYYYQVAEGTYSNPNDAFLAMIGNQEPRLKLVPMSWDQTHTINGSFSWARDGWTVSMIASYYTGRPYTPTVARASTVGSAAVLEFDDNSRRMPSRKNVDLLVRKAFPFRSLQVSLFVNAYNLLDIENQNAVWSDTGTADYTTTIEPSAIPFDANRVGTLGDYSRISGYYAEPRRIEIGMAVGF